MLRIRWLIDNDNYVDDLQSLAKYKLLETILGYTI